jgi:hypothetical protein
MDDERKKTEARLTLPGDAEQREVMQLWQRAESGMDGKRGTLPETPDDPVAYKLLDAAGDAMTGNRRKQPVPEPLSTGLPREQAVRGDKPGPL